MNKSAFVRKSSADSIAIAISAIALLMCVTTRVSAALVSIEALYEAPNGGAAVVTAVYDDTGFNGTGTEIFNFTEASLVFSAQGSSSLRGTSHVVADMFGVVFVDGSPVDFVNHNNFDPNTGKSLLIFNSNDLPPVGYGIYMSDFGSSMDVEGWWVVNHQAPQRHGLISISDPVPIPVPAAAWLFCSAFGLLGWVRRMW